MTVLVLMASSRRDGNTAAMVARLAAVLAPNAPAIVDLSALQLQPYSYDTAPGDDGFREVIAQMRLHAQIVFATPVYWYAMSGQMKIFFDRLSDLLEDAEGKRIARALAGRTMSLIATGTEAGLPAGFTEPFSRTAAYFGMQWGAACYVRSIQGGRPDEDQLAHIGVFARLFPPR